MSGSNIVVATPTLPVMAVNKAYADALVASGVTLYEVDFTGLATQNLRAGGSDADTNYTIDGKVWKIRNSNTQATTFALTNGVGIEWTVPNTVGAPGPCLRIPLTDLLPTWDYTRGQLEVWLRATQGWPQTVPGAGETKLSAVLTSDPGNVDWSVSKSQGLAFTRNGNASGLLAYVGCNPQATAGGDPFSNSASARQRLGTDAAPSLAPYRDVICLQILDQGTVSGYLGTWSAGWPTRSGMQFLGTLRQDLYTNGTPAAYGVTAGSSAQFWLSMNNNVGDGAQSAVVTNLRFVTR